MALIVKLPVLAVMWTLLCSSVLHLYPFRSVRWEHVCTVMDRSSIIIINAVSFCTPQLAAAARCRPSPAYTICTVLIPNAIGFVVIHAGFDGPSVFAGSILASVATAAFFHTYDTTLFYLCCTTLFFYGVGMFIFVRRPFGRNARRWGFHEWFHVCIVCGFAFNIVGVAHLAESCSEHAAA
jgi:predicted membrane channel-forming protein YqfA (hemolysin III family)